MTMNDVQISIGGTSIYRKFNLTGRTDLERTSGYINIAYAVETLILTDAANPETGVGGQRIYNRQVGLNMLKFLFRPDSPVNRALLKEELLKIGIYEPRISITAAGIRVSKDPLRPNVWMIRLKYTIVKTGETRNQVVPIFARDRFMEVLPA